jgi:alpha-D-xyloside xylohydrolase
MKKFQFQIFIILSICSILSTPSFSQEKQSDGVLFELTRTKDTDPRWLKIQVCTEDIIRVISSHEISWADPQHPSLMVVGAGWEGVPWTMTEDGDMVDIATARFTVRVNSKTGAVAFFDGEGKTLLRERIEGGKTITPAEVLGETTYHIHHLFDSPEDEAFYGLGQHQNDIMNYKGHNVDLWQHNMVAVVPFLVSSNNYGILWDNYSQTKFGDPREYEPISGLKTYNTSGEPTGLTAEYYHDAHFGSLLTERNERTVDYSYVDIEYDSSQGFSRDNGSVRWSGEISSDQSGEHEFRLYSSGYVKMWLNGELVVDSWRQNWLPWTTFFRLKMEAGEKYQVKIEWMPGGGHIGLTYLSPSSEDYTKILSLWSRVGDYIDYYFVYGENLDQVIRGYRTITGRSPMLPKWSFGFWQCRQRYRTQDELLTVVREFRKRGIPLDNIVQDWFYWREDQWGSHEFDPDRFPDPDGMVKTLHEDLNARIMISIWPKFYVGTKHFEEFKANGWLHMHNVQKGLRDWVGPGYVSTFFDPFSEDARNLYWKHVNEKLFSKGFDAWWVDATEPDLQSNVSPAERLLRVHPNALGTAARYENAFSLVMSKGIYENQRDTSPDQRVFILTRSAFAGQQRYAAVTWSGDVASRWYDLKAQVSAGLNISLSGIPYWTTDIGGFSVESRFIDLYDPDTHELLADEDSPELEEWREFNLRWHQFAAFLPLFRSHGEFPYREMYYIAPEDHPAYQSMLAYNKLRYRLMPYIYSLAGKVTREDYTIMRALVLDFGNDKNVLNIGDQYMFGPALLINPVTEYKMRSRPVYLPEGTGWYDFETGKYYEGGQTIDAGAPYSDIPIFIRAGSILPCGPEIRYTAEKPADPIRLFVYTGTDGIFTLYEDEEINYNYEHGKYSIIPIRYVEDTGSLIIGKRQGDFPGMLQTRTFEIVWIGSGVEKSGHDFDSEPDARITYDGNEVIVSRQ